MKKASHFTQTVVSLLLSVSLTFLLFTGCASTGGENYLDEKITNPKKVPAKVYEKFDVFGMAELTIKDCGYSSDINGTYREGISIKIQNNRSKEMFSVKSDANGFFYIKNLDKFTTYTIQLFGVKPDKQNPQSEWTFGVWKNFSCISGNIENVGLISAVFNDKTKDYQLTVDEDSSIAEYEKQYNTKFEKIEFKGPENYANAEMHKTGRVEPIIGDFISLEEVAKLQKKNPDGYIDVVCNEIRQVSVNDFDTVRMAHDVVTEILTYDVKSYFAGKLPPQDYKSVMKSGKSVCSGYAAVFKEFCNRLEIPCIVVSGFAKGAGFNPENPDLSTNHAWNTVCVDGDWYLIDCTWDSGYLNGTENVKEYKSDYLFVRPEQMIYSHYPEEKKYQLLEKPFDDEDILFVPNIRPSFFTNIMKGSYIEVESFDSKKKEFVLLAHYDKNFELNLINKVDVTRRICKEEQVSKGLKRYTINFDAPGCYQVNVKCENLIWNNVFAFVVR